VTARDVPAEERPSVNLTLVVDRSGSMAMGNRLGLVRDSLDLLTQSLRPDDTISVVGFDDQVELVVPPTQVEDRATIMGALASLTPRGSTDVEGGLSLGYEQARRAYRPGGINVVVLCSDGVANVGMTGPDGIAARIAEEGRNGIHLVTVGYGMGNYNDHLMEQLADQGDGFYRYVDTYDEAREVYDEELTSLLAPVADDARTQVEFDPEQVTSYRLVGYENRAMDDRSFGDLSADAGELGAGHHASALYEVRLAPDVEAGDRIGTAKVLWKTPGTDAPGFATAGLFAADPQRPMTDSLALATTVADLASVVKGYGSYDEPATTLYDVRNRAIALQERDVPGAAELVELASGLEYLE
jgi:Ca-activated chloride channel family protein